MTDMNMGPTSGSGPGPAGGGPHSTDMQSLYWVTPRVNRFALRLLVQMLVSYWSRTPCFNVRQVGDL